MTKHKKGNNNTRRVAPKKMPIEYAENSIAQDYGYITEVLGNCHFKINTINNEDRIASLCGTIKRNGKVKTGDLVLIEPMTDNLNGKYQIIFKYTQEQKKVLENEGKLVKIVNPNEETKENINSDEIDTAAASAFAFESASKAATVAQLEKELNKLFPSKASHDEFLKKYRNLKRLSETGTQ
jgi:initiation factor 1A